MEKLKNYSIKVITWMCSILLILLGLFANPFTFTNILLLVAGLLIMPCIKLFNNIKYKGIITLILFSSSIINNAQ